MPKVLVIGVDSMIGANLALVFGAQFDCVGVYHDHPAAPEGCQSHYCPASNTDRLVALVREIQPDWVVHCGPLAQPSWQPPTADQLGCDQAVRAERLAAVTVQAGCALTVLSTDAVFRGPFLFHEESFATTADGQHAREALRVEQALRHTHALVVRSHVYGWSPSETRPGFAQSVASRLLEGKGVALDGVRYASPILATDLASLLILAFQRRLSGLYHISGAERTNPHRFAYELAHALGTEAAATGLSASAAAPAPSASEASLNTRRARRDLGCPMPFLREGLERFAAQRVDGYLDRLRAGTSEPSPAAQAA